jgi:hypothetical protein
VLAVEDGRETGAPHARESPAEHEIMQMIREGRPLRVVAGAFGISISKASILSCGLASGSRRSATTRSPPADLRLDASRARRAVRPLAHPHHAHLRSARPRGGGRTAA